MVTNGQVVRKPERRSEVDVQPTRSKNGARRVGSHGAAATIPDSDPSGGGSHRGYGDGASRCGVRRFPGFGCHDYEYCRRDLLAFRRDLPHRLDLHCRRRRRSSRHGWRGRRDHQRHCRLPPSGEGSGRARIGQRGMFDSHYMRGHGQRVLWRRHSSNHERYRGSSPLGAWHGFHFRRRGLSHRHNLHCRWRKLGHSSTWRRGGADHGRQSRDCPRRGVIARRRGVPHHHNL